MSMKVIVAGFHRSGTSLTAQLLHRAGVFLGDQLLEANYSNVHGHVEDREIVRFHDKILADNELTWQVDKAVLPEVQDSHIQYMKQFIDKREENHRVWGFKDPRVCLLLNAWKKIIPEVKVLIVYRGPLETTFSLHKRAAIGSLGEGGKQRFHRKFWEVPDLSLNMWLVHNKMLLDFAHNNPGNVLVLSFDMMRRGFPLIHFLNQQWKLGLDEIATSSVFDSGATTESSGRLPVANSELVGGVLDTWEELERLSSETEALLGATFSRGNPLTEEAFYSAGDAYDILVDNELQKFKLEFLQDRAQTLEQNLEKTQAELEQAQRLAVSPKRRKELEEAETDLALIIGRMSRSKLSPIFRLKEEFRVLERKHLRGRASREMNGV